MKPTDDETIAEQAPGETPALSSLLESTPTPVSLESGMETGQGADDKPEIAIGDRHIADALPVSPDEARRMLGGKDG